MSRLSGTLPNPYEELYTSAKEFIASAAEQPNLELHRERFKARAIEDVSSTFSPSNPLAMGHEREAQKDYFRRLKLKFLEQEAKKSFLFCITGDVPQRVNDGENEQLESENATKKANLKAFKRDIEAMRAETLELSKENAANYAALGAQTTEITKLHREIRDMELELARIKTAHPPEDRMTVDEAAAKLDEQVEEIERLTAAVMETGAQGDELRGLVTEQANRVLQLAREREVQEAKATAVRRAREAGGTGTKVHDLCQWYETSLNTYRRLFGIRTARAVGPGQLVLEYDVPPRGGTAALELAYGDDGVLADVKLRLNGSSSSGADIEEAVRTAVDRNDTAGLIADVLLRLRPLECS